MPPPSIPMRSQSRSVVGKRFHARSPILSTHLDCSSDSGKSESGDKLADDDKASDRRLETPLAAMLPSKYANVDVRELFPDFRPDKVLRFSRLFGPGKPTSLPQIWRSVRRKRRKRKQSREGGGKVGCLALKCGYRCPGGQLNNVTACQIFHSSQRTARTRPVRRTKKSTPKTAASCRWRTERRHRPTRWPSTTSIC